jgi:ribulose-phosphate 3-epimerase
VRQREPQISASILNADFARLGAEVERAVAGGVDSIHLDVMDGHFVDNLTIGPVVVDALRPHAAVPFHSHLMISQPLRFVEEFANAGSDLIIFHVESDDDPTPVVQAIHRTGRAAGLAMNPETGADAVLPYLEQIDLLLVMTVHPGFGGQSFISGVLPKLRDLHDEIAHRHLELPIGIDGGVAGDTIAAAFEAGGDILVVGSALYRQSGDLAPIVDELRATARSATGQPPGSPTPPRPSERT